MMAKEISVLVIDQVDPVIKTILETYGIACELAADKDDGVLNELVKKADGLVLRSRWRLDKNWFKAHQNLKFVARVGAGLEHIDLAAASEYGIKVLSSPEGNSQSVAEHALGMLLGLMHKINVANEQVKKGLWLRNPNSGTELQGKTVGIIGFGNTGTAMARLMRAFDTEILVFDKYKTILTDDQVSQVTMQDIYHHADIVSLHLPLTPETTGLVSKQWLNHFVKPIYLINTSRGRIADDQAMLSGLETGALLGIALDVLSIELDNLTVPEWHSINENTKALIGHPKAIVTPHIAGLSTESYYKLSKIIADKIIRELGFA
jgi:D-3-phosphoglycerate dehydrogenase